MPLYNLSSRKAFSLIEVVASICLLGTLLVTVLVAYRNCSQQVRTAQKRLAALEALDQLLVEYSQPNSELLLESEAKLPGDNPFYWSVSQVDDVNARLLGAGVLRIELFDPEFLDGETLATVEILERAVVPQDVSR